MLLRCSYTHWPTKDLASYVKPTSHLRNWETRTISLSRSVLRDALSVALALAPERGVSSRERCDALHCTRAYLRDAPLCNLSLYSYVMPPQKTESSKNLAIQLLQASRDMNSIRWASEHLVTPKLCESEKLCSCDLFILCSTKAGSNWIFKGTPT